MAPVKDDEPVDPTKIKKSDVTNEERMKNLARLEEIKIKREMAARERAEELEKQAEAKAK